MYLIIVMNWDIVISWGTRNLVLSSGGREFSLWYLSTITGIFVGNFVLIDATSSFLVAVFIQNNLDDVKVEVQTSNFVVLKLHDEQFHLPSGFLCLKEM